MAPEPTNHPAQDHGSNRANDGANHNGIGTKRGRREASRRRRLSAFVLGSALTLVLVFLSAARAPLGDENQTVAPATGFPAAPKPLAVVTVYHEDFARDDGDWYFVTAAPFVAPNGVYEGEKLKINAQGSAYAFGYWESPSINVVSEGLYRAVFLVSAYTDIDRDCPQFRMRVTATSPSDVRYQMSSMTVVNSTGNGNSSPTTTPKYYEVYFRTPRDAERIRLEFDLMSFDGVNDDPDVSVRLEEVWVERLT